MTTINHSLGPNPRLSGRGLTSDRSRANMIAQLRTLGIRDQAVLDIMTHLPRHAFVESALEPRAYEDAPLPIGYQQTISAPYTVARMTELLLQSPRASQINFAQTGKVLEIGTGCGYQTAVLGKLFKEVYTIERIEKLVDAARRNLRDLRYYNVRYKHADGMLGYPDAAPYDAIIVTAAAKQVPPALVAQLAVGARLVIPMVNPANPNADDQRLGVVDRNEGGVDQRIGEAVRFVPLLPGTVAT
jgi:protein-L-isoaspartate(D-aspartate) O-methyltransferase